MRLLLLLQSCLQISWSLLAQDSPLRCIGADETTGTSKAVIVDANAALVHTRQVFPGTELNAGGLKDAAGQAEEVLNNLELILNRTGSDLTNAVKLNIYLREAGALLHVRKVLARRFAGTTQPAASFVVSTLPVDGVVAMDAVATTLYDSGGKAKIFPTVSPGDYPTASDAAILPAGPRVYVSGMADTNTLPEATKKTLEKLTAAISHLGLGKSDIVQLKAFLQPNSQGKRALSSVQKTIAQFFEGNPPPTIFVEWLSPPPNPTIEIELITAGKSLGTNVTELVTYLTPPGTTSTKVFSRVVRINHGNAIYISGLYGLKGQRAGDEIREIFQSLGEILPRSGSDFEHLVKATYYVSDEVAGEKLNEIRPQFYNPLRPPAASKAKVRGVAVADKTVMVDMIAVTK